MDHVCGQTTIMPGWVGRRVSMREVTSSDIRPVVGDRGEHSRFKGLVLHPASFCIARKWLLTLLSQVAAGHGMVLAFSPGYSPFADGHSFGLMPK